MTIRSFSGPRRQRTSAAAWKLPLGEVVCPCAACGKDVHASELTFTYAHGIRWVHRACRWQTKESV